MPSSVPSPLPRQIFLTGASGFVGGYLLRELSARGYRVATLVRDPAQVEPLREFAERVVVGDLHDTTALERGVAGTEAIIHVAGIMAAARPKDFVRVNVEGTRNLLQAANRVAGNLERFVLLSSVAAAGPSAPGEPLVETDPPRPVSHYGSSKLAAEGEAWRYTDRFGVTVLRPPVVYGPGDTQTLTFFKMVQQGRVWSAGDPRMQLSLLFISDLAAGIIAALEAPAAANQTYFLAGDARPRVEELLAAIGEILSARARVVQVPPALANAAATLGEVWGRLRGRPSMINRDKLKELGASGSACSNRKAKQELAWQPEVGYHDGLRQAAEWYFDRGWLSHDL